MSRVAGEPIAAAPAPTLTVAMVEAYRTLFTVPVPPDTPLRHWGPGAFLQNNVDWIEQERRRADLPDVVRLALDASRGWHENPPVGIDEVQDPVIAQGDARIDNMLWDGVRFRLIDFEGFGVGDLAFEVADLAEHISARLPGLRDTDAVIDGFSLGPPRRERVQAYRIVLATLWLLEVLPGNRGEALNPEGTAALQAVHLLNLLGRPGRGIVEDAG